MSCEKVTFLIFLRIGLLPKHIQSWKKKNNLGQGVIIVTHFNNRTEVRGKSNHLYEGLHNKLKTKEIK